MAEPSEIQTKLEKLFEGITKNFSKRKDDFEALKKKTPAELCDMHKAGELQSISKEWQREMELHLSTDEPSKDDKSGQAISNFIQENQSTFNEIEMFMHLVNDWLEETNTTILSQGASDSQASSFQNEGGEASKGEMKRIVQPEIKPKESQKSLLKATAEVQANIQAQQ